MQAGYPVNPAQIYNGNTIHETWFYLSRDATNRSTPLKAMPPASFDQHKNPKEDHNYDCLFYSQ